MENDVLSTTKSTPLDGNKITPLPLEGRIYSRKGYVDSDRIKELAIDKYKNKNRKGITYQDLRDSGLATHKRQAQDMLKYHLKKGTLFTLTDTRPQQYYPSIMRSEIIKNELDKNTPIDPTGVNPFSTAAANADSVQTLQAYILPLLPSAPIFIHNMPFKIKIPSEHYAELNLGGSLGNNGKRHFEIIGKAHINYTLYPRGTVNVEVQCSNNPFSLKDEIDRAKLHAFFGQVRDRLVNLLNDTHERIVPDIMEWYATECDINKDIKVSDWLHFSGLRIQVKHLDHIFRIYIKSMGEDTVSRVE